MADAEGGGMASARQVLWAGKEGEQQGAPPAAQGAAACASAGFSSAELEISGRAVTTQDFEFWFPLRFSVNIVSMFGDGEMLQVAPVASAAYPTWGAWKFHRSLTYWISVMYLEGSILFIVGAAFSMTSLVRSASVKEFELALVATPYFVGGICFTVGSYVGVLEAINAASKSDHFEHFCIPIRRRGWEAVLSRVSWKAVAGYGAYIVGAVFFNVDTIGGYLTLDSLLEALVVWTPASLGGIGFTVGAILECHANKVWLMRVKTCEWWLSICNFVGAVFFVVAGVAGGCHAEGDAQQWLVNFTYLAGSIGFMIGSICTMWLWKCEQYGLGMLPEMNIGQRVKEPTEDILSMHAEYGCGRATASQLPFLTMYLVNASASVSLIGIALFLPGHAGNEPLVFAECFEAILTFMLSHGVMLLGSVVHHVPTARPHSWMLIYMRVVLTFFTVNSWMTVFRRLSVKG